MNTQIQEMAELLDSAAKNASPIAQLSGRYNFSEKDAYAIQAASIQRRHERGEQLIGLKMGFTSRAKMEQMGVHDMIWGRLTAPMLLENGALVLDRFIHPRAEPELCFKIDKRIDRQIGLEECSAYVSKVAAAIEVIDSRYENFKFSLEDVIADNCSSAALVIGEWQEAGSLDLSSLGMQLQVNGDTIAEGSSSAILGNPWESLVEASRLATKYGLALEAGSILMAGAATPAKYVERGQEVSVIVEQLGQTGFKVV